MTKKKGLSQQIPFTVQLPTLLRPINFRRAHYKKERVNSTEPFLYAGTCSHSSHCFFMKERVKSTDPFHCAATYPP